jgi:hypothetical protein
MKQFALRIPVDMAAFIFNLPDFAEKLGKWIPILRIASAFITQEGRDLVAQDL